MPKSSSFDSCPCPDCGVLSNSISHYTPRILKHYALNQIETKTYTSVRYRCKNASCLRKSFVHYPVQEGLEELSPRSRYTKSSKFFVANKMLKHQVSYNSLQTQLQEDFGSNTSLSTLYTWTKNAKVANVSIDKRIKDKDDKDKDVKVLHTDEKHPSKKKV
jgi:hypothetical protein